MAIPKFMRRCCGVPNKRGAAEQNEETTPKPEEIVDGQVVEKKVESPATPVVVEDVQEERNEADIIKNADVVEGQALVTEDINQKEQNEEDVRTEEAQEKTEKKEDEDAAKIEEVRIEEKTEEAAAEAGPVVATMAE